MQTNFDNDGIKWTHLSLLLCALIHDEYVCGFPYEILCASFYTFWLPCMENANLIATYTHIQCMYFHIVCTISIINLPLEIFDDVYHRFANKTHRQHHFEYIIIIVRFWLVEFLLFFGMILCICITNIFDSNFHDIRFHISLFLLTHFTVIIWDLHKMLSQCKLKWRL